MPNYILFADGACRNNPGAGSSAWVLCDFPDKIEDKNFQKSQLLGIEMSKLKNSIVLQNAQFYENTTNNQAEWQSLLFGLQETWAFVNLKLQEMQEMQKIQENSAEKFQIWVCMDSKLVIEQISGHWKVKDAKMQILCQKTQEILQKFSEKKDQIQIKFQHIFREFNTLADKLGNDCLDQKLGITKIK